MRYSVTFILLMTGLLCNSQTVSKPVIIESKVHTGIVLPLYEAIDYLLKDDVYAFDISASFPASGKDFWEVLYRYPRSGLGTSYWTLGNNEVFGKAFSLYGFVNVPLFSKKEKYLFDYQVSFGGAYLTKRFDKDQNPLDRAIGSHGNIYIRLSLDGRVKLSARSEIVLETGLTHFSNGKTRSPNYGINACTVSLGYNHLFNDYKLSGNSTDLPVPDKRYIQSVTLSAGLKVYDNLADARYLSSTLSYNLDRVISHKHRLGIGADLFYDGSLSEALAGADGTNETDKARFFRGGIHASWSICYKRLIMGIQAGYHIDSKHINFTPVYNKVSLNYLLSRNMTGLIVLRSHMGKADSMEFGIGYLW